LKVRKIAEVLGRHFSLKPALLVWPASHFGLSAQSAGAAWSRDHRVQRTCGGALTGVPVAGEGDNEVR
jgi:hypothetical protein